jgi:hypothetical protein
MPFKGKYNLMLSNFKGSYLTPSEEAFKEVVASVQIIECILQQVKIFGALGSKGHWHCDKAKHPIVFNNRVNSK